MKRYRPTETHEEETDATHAEALRKHYCNCGCAWPTAQKLNDHLKREPTHERMDPRDGISHMRWLSQIRFDRQVAKMREGGGAPTELESFEHLGRCPRLTKLRAEMRIEGACDFNALELTQQVLLVEGFRAHLEEDMGEPRNWFD
jgi:hypothetical protein